MSLRKKDLSFIVPKQIIIQEDCGYTNFYVVVIEFPSWQFFSIYSVFVTKKIICDIWICILLSSMVPGSRNPMWGEEFNFSVDELPVEVSYEASWI